MAKTCLCAGCDLPVWSNGYCSRHQSLRTDDKWKRTLEKQKDKKAKPIAKVSAKKLAQHNGNIWAAGKIGPMSETRKAEYKIYIPARDKFLLENPKCQAKLFGCCSDSIEVHHKKGKIGKMLYNVKWFLAVCRNCHNWCEANPEAAKKLKLSTSRLAKDKI